MKTEWRPDDWIPLNCDKCDCREARCETWCQLYRTYEDAASAMLSARDKWWIDRVENIALRCRIVSGKNRCECIGCYGFPFVELCVLWQELKKESGHETLEASQ